MSRKKNARSLSILLAVCINALPLSRIGIAITQLSLRPSYAVVFQWIGISATLLGSHDAVSGASTIITSPSQASGKVGEPFSYRITSAPDQGNIFDAKPLPKGLALGTGRRRSFIEGTPNEPGTFEVTILASDDNRPSRTVTKLLTLTIEPDVLPLKLLSTPLDQSLDIGQDVFLSVLAVGSGPIRYQWFHNDQALPNQTSPVLKLRSAQSIHSGKYHVTIENPVSSLTSVAAQITITEPTPLIPPQITRIHSTNAGIQLNLNGTPGSSIVIETNESITNADWTTLDRLTLDPEGRGVFTDKSPTKTARFYRARRE